MKAKHLLLWSLAGVMALSACSSENDLTDGGNGANGESRFMAVEVMNPTNLTRAEGDYEKGTDDENNIKSLRFYFFDNNGNPATVKGGVNFVNAEPSSIVKDGDDMENVELKLKAILVINTKEGDNANVNTVLAVANYGNANLGDASLSLGELKAKVSNYNATTEQEFLMTSSSYAGAESTVTAATIKPENLCTTEDAALASPVAIYIERLVAKTRLNTEWNAEMTKLPLTLDGTQYEAVALKDKNNLPIKVGEKQVYAIFKGWNVTSTADKSHLIKSVNTTSAWNLGWNWNTPDYSRSHWAMNPESMSLYHIAYNGATNAVGEDAFAYCFENAADNYANGTKTVYEPDKAISNRTQALIAAVLVTDNNGVAEPVSLAKWAGSDYTVESVKTAMYAQVTSQIFYETTAEGASERTFASITPDMVELVTAKDAGQADDLTEDSKRYLTYLKLTETASTTQFYTAAVKNIVTEGKTEEEISAAIDATKYADAAAVNNVLAQVPGAKVWNSGMTYYYTDLQHLGTTADKGLYGVVRNHIYDVNINSVKGLGTPVYDPEETIIPQKPKDDDTYIAAQVNVLSWRVVKNNVDLAW